MSKFRIVPVGEGRFTVEMLTFFGFWKPFIVLDTHVGHGGDEHWPMQASKPDCEKVIRFLQLFKGRVERKIHWTVVQRIAEKLNIKYFWLKHEYTPKDIPEHVEVNFKLGPVE